MGPLPTGGGGYTVNQGGFNRNVGFAQRTVVSYRQIIDLGDLSKSVSIHTTGQSGQAFSKHYTDFVELWQKGRYHPMLFYQDDIERDEEARARQSPPPSQQHQPPTTIPTATKSKVQGQVANT